MTEPDDFYLGVDIGGTTTALALADRCGVVRHVLNTDGANHELCGAETAEEIVSSAVRRIMREAGIEGREPSYVFYGAAGADTDADDKLLRGIFGRTTPGGRFDLSNDGVIALKSGTVDGVGIVVTCGTGNINFAANSRGVVRKIGGLAFFGGDILGAHHIAGETFRAALRSKDGRGAPTALERLLPEALDVASVEDISELDRSPAAARRAVETLFAAADAGDGVALEITWDLVRETIDIVGIFFNDLFRGRDPFTLVLEGSVFKHGYRPLDTMLTHAVRQRYPATIVVPEWDPVVGALFYAFERAGIELTEELAGKIIDSYLDRRTSR